MSKIQTPLAPIMFVLRFWLERFNSGARWRGRIEHIPSGSHGEFLGGSELLKYLQGFEITLDDSDQFKERIQK